MNANLHKNIIVAIDKSKTLSLRTVSYRNKVRASLEDVLMRFLQKSNMEHIHTQLCYCLHELGSNAHRANLKRAYFIDKKLDIKDIEQYRIGMEQFKSDIIGNIVYYQNLADKMGLYIKFDFHLDDSYLTVKIRNNTPILENELEKIQNKIEAASQYDNLMDAYSAIEDGSEGAGLGLVTIFQLLYNSGCSPDCFSIDKSPENNETIASLLLKLDDLQAPEELESL